MLEEPSNDGVGMKMASTKTDMRAPEGELNPGVMRMEMVEEEGGESEQRIGENARGADWALWVLRVVKGGHPTGWRKRGKK